MALKFPPPPQFSGPQWQQLNRWFLEIQSILSAAGTTTFADGSTAVTQPLGDNSNLLATDAFVIQNAGGVPAAAIPPVDATPGRVGLSIKYAREDHAHPTDTSRAGLASANVFTATQVINGNTGAPLAPTFTGDLQIVGADGALNALTLDAYGSVNLLDFRSSGGTQAAKTAVAANSQLFNLHGAGWNGSGYIGCSAVVMFSAEPFTGVANGTYTSFFTVTIGGTAQSEKMRLQQGLSVGLTAVATDPGVGNMLLDGTVQTGAVTVASLPAAGKVGRRSFVTDATVTTFASIVAGGGANKVPVYDDGANWRIG